ncbi:methyltransferase-like protein 27 [Anneissia japonica]|uniref:methyltransferase-like protein 27 n=1 Tax=Anneissia japonica TaxID=1529436 RepID=UPI00142558CC|nr:methyltransferase-like protein 27 [Anneissia japonica]XP_033124128.1 methyltransferase-like protein 27 [Anneissia japonica]
MEMDASKKFENKLMDIIQGSSSKNDVIEKFDDLADTFDEFSKGSGYTAPKYCSTLLSEHIPDRKANILDFGCGTGLVGEQLYQLSFQNIDGFDCAPKCLQVAENKQIFKRLFCEFFSGQTLNLATDFYDGLICVGGFFASGLKANCFREWIRIVKPGKHF